MTDINDSSWYVIQTQVNAEAKAMRNLLRQGFEPYLPRYLKRRSHARKIDKVAAPLFPRYMFVKVTAASQRWRSIQSTFGVSRLVLNGSEPARVGPAIVGALQAREDTNGFVTMDMQRQFSLGEKVRVLAGAFTDSFGLFDGLCDRDRVAILLDLLGRKVRVSIEADFVSAA